MAFTHLHLHTQYSLLDGAAKIKDVVKRAKELGMEHLAITDHGVMFGVVDFYKECTQAGIHPVIGCEAYMATGSRFSRDKESDRRQYHLVLLAKNQTGYQNLIKLVSAGWIEGHYYKPRIDKEILREHSEGLICLSACLAGIIPRLLLAGDYEGAKKEALEHLEIFGEGNYYLEVQDQGLEEQRRLVPLLRRLSEETGIPLVATNDVHYIEQKDAEAHDVLLCIQTGAKVEDEDRMRYANDQFYLKSEKEMRNIFAAIPEACDNTVKIAEKCDVTFEFGKLHLPKYPVPDGKKNNEYLRELCEEGMLRKYGEVSEELRERLETELAVIEQMGFVDYFLIVWDYVNYAKSHGIMVGPGRGSAAGSIVAYALDITDIDPIKYGLIFERFLNPERISMPDIDIDFPDDRRGEVIDYVIAKYGTEHVAQIITFGTLKARAAVRDVGRVLGVSYAETDRIAKSIPNILGITIDRALKMNQELARSYEDNENTRRVIDMARALEGMPRNTSTHAAGVVISEKSVGEYVPLYSDGEIIETQFEKNTLEELGLLKMDFLGLRNIKTIGDALSLIQERHGVDIDFSKMEYDDPAIFEMISQGNTQGVFQLESSGMTNFMKSLKPEKFEEIVAGISLFRPGPMDSIPRYQENRKDPSKIQYLHESLRPILDVTYGCIVYQEQVMQIVRDLAGYSYGRSDEVRRMMAKKKMDKMEAEKEYFINGKKDAFGNVEIPGAVANGVPRDIAETIFNSMISFAEYAFNKSHAAAYAVITYETAYLKYYYPLEYMTALLSSVMGDSKTSALYIRNCRDMGIEVLPPDVNRSFRGYSIEDGKIRFGLKAVKNVGENAISAILDARGRMGPATDLRTFIENAAPGGIKKNEVESLIRAGATKSLEGNMAQQMAVCESYIESVQSQTRNTAPGQISLFETNKDEMTDPAAMVKLPNLRDFSDEQKLAMEKELLGVYISGHPLEAYRSRILRAATTDSLRISESAEEGEMKKGGLKDGDNVVVCGMVTGKRTLPDKRNNLMAFVQLEDLYGELEIIVFSRTYERCAALLEDDSVVMVRGRLSFREDQAPSITADDIIDMKTIPEPQAQAGAVSEGPRTVVKLRIPPDADEAGMLEEIGLLIGSHPGSDEIRIYTKNGKTIRPRGTGVEASDGFVGAARMLLGEENVKRGVIS